MDVSEAQEAKQLRDENARLKRLGGGPEPGQGSVAGNPKKRMELVAMKAAVEQMRAEYAFSQRPACGLLTIPVSNYRYQARSSDELAIGVS
jgi:hypothetical protein